MTRPTRFLAVAALLAALVAVTAAPPALSGSRRISQLRSLNHRVASAINAYRVAHGLAPLTVSSELNDAARQHSVEMGVDGYFDHSSADGTPFWERIQQYYTSSGYTYWTAGENLLWSSPTVGAKEALDMWIASPAHLANLKSKNWTEIGVSSVHVIHAGGVYGGNTVTIITTDFGARH